MQLSFTEFGEHLLVLHREHMDILQCNVVNGMCSVARKLEKGGEIEGQILNDVFS